jgi:hypothetical protein
MTDTPDGRPPSQMLRRLDRALSQLNPWLAAVVMGLVVLDLTCLAARLLPVSHLAACTADAAPPDRAAMTGDTP